MIPRSEPSATHHDPPRATPDIGRPALVSWAALTALIALCAVLFFVGMGRVALIDPDEPYYAVPALEMLRAGSWHVPLFHGQPWFDKPILFYWIVLGGFRILGTTELAARIGSGLAALAGVVAMFFHARRRAAGAGTPGTIPTILPPLILATSLEYAVLARFAITDMTLTLFLTLGMIAAWRFLASGRSGWIALAGACFGLALLTKGPVGLLLPVLALGLWSTLARRADLLRPASLAAAGAGVAAAAGPWYAYMWIAHRDLLLGTFLGQGNLGRFLKPEHQTSPFFYLVVLLLGLVPWSGALPFALVESVRRAVRGPAPEPGEAGRDAPDHGRAYLSPLFELCWFATVLLVFSISASRLATYILPAFPPAALLLGDYWSRRLDGARRPGNAKRGLAWALPALVGVPCALVVVLGARSEAAGEWVSESAILIELGLLLGAASIAASLLARMGGSRAFLAAQAATSVLVILVVVFVAAPRVERQRSARPLVEELRRRGLEAEVVGAVRERDFSVDFYLGRTLPRATGRRALQAAVAEHPGGIWVVPRANVGEVTSNLRLAVTPVVETPTASALRLSPAAVCAGSPPVPAAAGRSLPVRGNEG